MVTDQTMNIVISIPNFEQATFKNRTFEISFEEKKASEFLETPVDMIKGIVRVSG